MGHTIRLPVIVDVGIVFVLRDIMVGLFEQKQKINDIYVLSVLLLGLGVIRIGLGCYCSTKEQKPDLN